MHLRTCKVSSDSDEVISLKEKIAECRDAYTKHLLEQRLKQLKSQ
jgi:hypothetical protein